MRRLIAPVIAALVLGAVASAGAVNGPPSNSSTGTGQVFFPNPVAQLQDQTLTDQKDADYAALAPAYRTVQLTNLDGSGFLRGDFATVVSETGPPAYSSSNSFVYRRDDDRFEQVMAYYWITKSQLYLRSLGFGTGAYRAVNGGSQAVRLNQWGVDNSFATTHPRNEIRLGKGGVDDAEDAEVIVHEYGHSIHFAQDFAFASTEAGAISEGFGDYWAVTVTNVVSPTPDAPCVADWDAVSYTSAVPHCLRRVDRNLHYPEDLRGSVHFDGQIWSRALWDIRKAIGHVKADTVIIEGQWDFDGTTMPQLAEQTVAAAKRIYGNATAKSVETAFEARGIL